MTQTLFSDTKAGYRLDFFQLYNWGIFDGSIYTVDARKKSTLLTGENGSGKTTLVDALMTLLVPQNMRFYNQSSGSNHKHDRSEESYVLGAYGNKQENGTGEAKTQTLRDSSAYSILAGSFTDDCAQNTVSLLQVRYFSGETLTRVFAITKKKLSIQDINDILSEEGACIDRSGAWRKILSAKAGTIFFGDNFKKYSETYSSIFGFRSDKALRLFSQIVGLKVLGNLTDFIRTNMLEEQDTVSRYEQLRSGYQNLMQSSREILKAKAQIEMLQPIEAIGKKWKEASEEKMRLSAMKEYAPAWYTTRSREIISDELENIRETLQHSIEERNEELAVQEELQKEIDSIKISIAQNAASQRLTQIRLKIDSLEKERGHIEEEKVKFNQKLQSLGIEPPLTEQGFESALKTVKARQSAEQSKKAVLDKRRIELYTAEKDEKQRISEIQNELSSLGSRPSSNIPFENIEIRSRICSALSISEEKLPFAGELLCVKESESKWSFAIERLLHSFALTLLVTPDIYDDVTNFVKNTNMRGRVVYLKTEDELFFGGESADANSVPGKIDVRENHELCEWITNYVRSHFNFLCTDDTDEIARAKQAISSSGLIKKGLRHEKDDRSFIKQNSQVLGWDNSLKRQDLSTQLDSLKALSSEKEKERVAIDSELDEIEEKIRAIKNISEITKWREIDTDGFDDEIASLRAEEARLLSGDENIKELQSQLNAVLAKKEKSTERTNTFTGIIAVLQDKQKGREEKLEQYNRTFDLLKASLETEEGKVAAKDFESEYEKNLGAKTVDELEKSFAFVSSDIEKRSAECSKREAELSQQLIRQMSAIKNPNQTLRENYGDWSSEFIDMDASVDSLGDFLAVYDTLLKDNLPRYQNEFNEYLHETMNNDIIDFCEYIKERADEIRFAINALNESLKSIAYESAPETYLQLLARDSSDVRIKELKALLKDSIPDSALLDKSGEEGEKYREALFLKVKALLDYLDMNDANRKFVLDIRNWFTFAASENYAVDSTQKQYYNDSASLSGGEKAKLTYTILASAIAYQFGINNGGASSFRFVIVDEAFSKSDSYNSEYAMRLFKQIDLQLMVVTPLDKINIVEDYISSVHLTENKNTADSRLLSMSIETYKSAQIEQNIEQK